MTDTLYREEPFFFPELSAGPSPWRCHVREKAADNLPFATVLAQTEAGAIAKADLLVRSVAI